MDLRYAASEFLHKINVWEGRKEGMDLSISCVPAEQLPAFVMGETRKNPPRGRPMIDVTLCPQMVTEGCESPPKRAKRTL